jgi:hypothetical protein
VLCAKGQGLARVTGNDMAWQHFSDRHVTPGDAKWLMQQRRCSTPPPIEHHSLVMQACTVDSTSAWPFVPFLGSSASTKYPPLTLLACLCPNPTAPCVWTAGNEASPVALLQMPHYKPGKPWEVDFVVFGGSWDVVNQDPTEGPGWFTPCR